MDIIKPIATTDDNLVSSSVAENDHSEWSAATVYSIGDYCISTTTHKIYLCKVASTNNDPTEEANIYDDEDEDAITGYWEEVSSTNKWKMFDGKSRAATTATSSIVVSIAPGALFNSLAILNIEAVNVNVTVTDPTAGEVYNSDVDLVDNSEAIDAYTWCFSPIIHKPNAVVTDLPSYPDATVTITATDEGNTVEIGEIVVGTTKYIGALNYGYEVGMEDYSTKDKDDDGNVTLIEGVYSNTIELTGSMKPSMVYDVQRTLASYRATPLVWVGYAGKEETITYGWFSDFDITIPGIALSYITIDVEELS